MEKQSVGGGSLFAGRCLHVAPIAANVKHVDKGQRCHLLYVLLDRLSADACGERWATFCPRVTPQTEPVILDGFGRLRGYENRVPARVLFDPEWSLVQTIGDLRPGSKIIILPVVRDDFLCFELRQSTRNAKSRSGFHETTPPQVGKPCVAAISTQISFRGQVSSSP